MADGLPHDSIGEIAPALDGSIWVITFGGGLVQYDDRTFWALTKSDGLPSAWVSVIREGRNRGIRGLWLGTGDFHDAGGVAFLDGSKVNHWSKGTDIDGGWMTDIRFDGRERMWVSSHLRGLFRHDASGLTNLWSTSIMGRMGMDREGTLWVGNSVGEVRRYREDDWTAYGAEHGLVPEIIRAFHHHSDGTLWMASTALGWATGTLFRLDGWSFLPASGGNSPLFPQGFRCFASGPDGSLWVGSPVGPLAPP